MNINPFIFSIVFTTTATRFVGGQSVCSCCIRKRFPKTGKRYKSTKGSLVGLGFVFFVWQCEIYVLNEQQKTISVKISYRKRVSSTETVRVVDINEKCRTLIWRGSTWTNYTMFEKKNLKLIILFVCFKSNSRRSRIVFFLSRYQHYVLYFSFVEL